MYHTNTIIHDLRIYTHWTGYSPLIPFEVCVKFVWEPHIAGGSYEPPTPELFEIESIHCTLPECYFINKDKNARLMFSKDFNLVYLFNENNLYKLEEQIRKELRDENQG